MKQFTTPKQTAKLIELRFEKPKSIVDHDGFWGYNYAYSIGELIEMLPRNIGECPLIIHGSFIFEKWAVFYKGAKGFSRDELIDALYEMVIKLKAEGVI